MSQAIIFYPDRPYPEVIDFPEENHLPFYYEKLECSFIDIVGAYGLKQHSAFESLDLVVDDEGMLKAEPKFNLLGSLAYGFMEHEQPLFGTVILCKHDGEGGNIGLTPEELDEAFVVLGGLMGKFVSDLERFVGGQ